MEKLSGLKKKVRFVWADQNFPDQNSGVTEILVRENFGPADHYSRKKWSGRTKIFVEKLSGSKKGPVCLGQDGGH